jgi:hypothetical protein
LLTVATEGFEETQVPPVEGCRFVDEPIHIVVLLELTVGFAFTVTLEVGNETQPVVALVKVK